MSRHEREVGRDHTERLFYRVVSSLGLKIEISPSIRSPYAVADKNGEIRKVVTQPDFLVTDVPMERSMYVEITTSSGDLDAKRAQQRVVEAAGITNYIQLTGDQVHALSLQQGTPSQFLLFSYFGWE
jgi:hypothetical protein